MILKEGLKTYTIVFSSGCTSYDGKIRSGVVTLDLTGASYNQAGSVLVIRLNNFYINGNHLQGKLVAENLGSGEVKVAVSDDEGSGRASLHLSTLNDNKVTYWKTIHKRSIFEGNNDQIMLNNKYYILPYQDNINPYEGVTSDGKEYYGKITSSLLLDYSCTATGNLRYPLSGNTSLYFISGGRLNVDYGDGTCNYAASMSIAGNSRNFSLY